MAQIDTLTNVGAVVSTDLALILRGGANVLGTFGSLVGQNATSVVITGGTINATTIGGVTAAAGSFTTLGATGAATFSGNVGIGITPSNKLTVFGTGVGNATVQIEGEGGADPYINFLTNNTQHWSLGVDDSDADKFKLSEHSALGVNDYLTVDVTGNVGINTSSPSAPLDVDRSFSVMPVSTTTVGNRRGLSIYNNQSGGFLDTTLVYGNGANSYFAIGHHNGTSYAERLRITSSGACEWRPDGTTQAMTLDASGNLLVGTTVTNAVGSSSGGTSVGVEAQLSGEIQIGSDGDKCVILNRQSSDGEIVRLRKDGTTVGSIGTYSGTLAINSVNTGIMLDDTNNVLRPTNSSGGSRDAIISLGTSSQRFKDLHLSGSVGIGSSGSVRFNGIGDNTHAVGYDSTIDGSFIRGQNGIRFITATGSGTERMRIDGASGNLFLGTTNSNIFASSSENGLVITPTGQIRQATNAVSMYLNRTGSNGTIAEFRKDGATVGSIGSAATGGGSLIIGNDSSGIMFRGDLTGSAFIPANPSTGAQVDNSLDVGHSVIRFDDIYATNGTIQTSDRNEKQDIEALSDAETAVAVACKGLLRKFRWIDSVEEKGDDARIHFGIIAQDLQAAFAAEGLDAGRYAMFISSTWWETQTEVEAVEAVEFVQAVEAVYDENGELVSEAVEGVEAVEAKDAYTRTDTFQTLADAPEGATERTRLGVRYPELLAFIIAAI